MGFIIVVNRYLHGGLDALGRPTVVMMVATMLPLDGIIE